MNRGMASIVRWRMHIAAAVVLLLVMGVAAVAGQDARSVARAARSGRQGGSVEAGRTAASELALTGPEAGAAGGAVAAGRAGSAGGVGATARAPRAGPGRHVTYDDGASDTEVRIGGSTFTSGPAAV